jgi:hypothetical protein
MFSGILQLKHWQLFTLVFAPRVLLFIEFKATILFKSFLLEFESLNLMNYTSLAFLENLYLFSEKFCILLWAAMSFATFSELGISFRRNINTLLIILGIILLILWSIGLYNIQLSNRWINQPNGTSNFSEQVNYFVSWSIEYWTWISVALILFFSILVTVFDSKIDLFRNRLLNKAALLILIVIFPLGVWFLQPRINRAYAGLTADPPVEPPAL